MKTLHKHKFKYLKKLKEELCLCGENKKHRHKYTLIEQRTVIVTNINIYKCRCGKEKVEYEMFGGIKLRPDFYKKQGKELLE